MRVGPTTVGEVCAAMDELAPPGLAYPGDTIGLAVGSPDAKVASVLVALTLTPGAFESAKRARARLIVCHHPPIRTPLGALRTNEPETRLLLDLVKDGIACFAAHTNLDVAPGGVNDAVAGRLGLKKCTPLLPVPHAGQVKIVTFVPESHLARVRRAVCDAGAGVIGEYRYCSFSAPGVGTFLPSGKARPFSGRKHVVNEEPERRFEVVVPKARLDAAIGALKQAHPYEEVAYDVIPLESHDRSIGLGVRGELGRAESLEGFARAVRKALAVSHVRVVGASGRERRRVRVVGVLAGSGGSEVKSVPEDLDVFMTGDVRYHDALAAQSRGLALVDPGHAGMEKWVAPVVVAYLRKAFKGLRVSKYTEPELFRAITG